MTLQEFTAKMNPLLEKGRKTYTGSVLDLIFAEVKNITLSDFERLVKHLNGSARFAPMVPDFRKAILELNIKPIRPKLEIVETTAHILQPENFLYHLQGNAWADNNYIYLRGNTIRECGFVVKMDQPHHPLVKLDEEVREQKIKECKEHLKNRTFPKFEESKNAEMRRLNFSDFDPGVA